MSKKLDVTRVDQALKRAARRATSGTPEERAGRFVVREADSGRFLDKDDKKPRPAKSK